MTGRLEEETGAMVARVEEVRGRRRELRSEQQGLGGH